MVNGCRSEPVRSERERTPRHIAPNGGLGPALASVAAAVDRVPKKKKKKKNTTPKTNKPKHRTLAKAALPFDPAAARLRPAPTSPFPGGGSIASSTVSRPSRRKGHCRAWAPCCGETAFPEVAGARRLPLPWCLTLADIPLASLRPSSPSRRRPSSKPDLDQGRRRSR